MTLMTQTPNRQPDRWGSREGFRGVYKHTPILYTPLYSCGRAENFVDHL